VSTKVNGLTQAPGDVTIERLPAAPEVRRAADVMRLILAVAVLVAAQLVAILGHTGVRTTEGSVLRTITTLPPTLRDALTVAGQVVVVLLPLAIVVGVLAGRRFAVAGRLVLAALAGAGAEALLSYFLLHRSHPAMWPALLAGRGGLLAVTFPPIAWLSAMTATVTVAGPAVSKGWRAGLWWVTGTVAAIEVVVGGFLLVDAVVAASLGVSVGSLVLLIFGGPAGRPSPDQVVVALRECGVDVVNLEQLRSEPGSPDVCRATTREGTVLTVQVFASDDRDRDRLGRLTRWLLVRNPEDDRAGTTVLSAAEHEMLAMVAAARAGARVAEPVVAYPIPGGRGPSGALVAWIHVGGRRLDDLASDRISDEVLAELWYNVRRLQEHRLAHRRLRSDHVLLDDAGRVWLTGFALAELGATDRQLATDVAELLTSLAVFIGAERAAASAVEGLGEPAVTAAARYVQRLALSGRTRAEVRAYDRSRAQQLSSGSARRRLRPGGRPDLLANVRSAVGQIAGEIPAKPEPLARFTWKRTLAVLGAFVIVYLVLPQLANAGAAVKALQNADWWWVLAAVPRFSWARLLPRCSCSAPFPASCLSGRPTWCSSAPPFSTGSRRTMWGAWR
jgi:glycosyltransferase 2 family protein